MGKKVTLMVGCPGSGKSTLAEKLAKKHNGVIISTDNFFMVNGEYKWTGDFITWAHKWCQGQFYKLVFLETPYIIIDNCNLQDWNCYEYIDCAVKNDYEWELIEPTTKWRYDPVELATRNSHNVPQSTIERMLKDRQNISDMDKKLRLKFKK